MESAEPGEEVDELDLSRQPLHPTSIRALIRLPTTDVQPPTIPDVRAGRDAQHRHRGGDLGGTHHPGPPLHPVEPGAGETPDAVDGVGEDPARYQKGDLLSNISFWMK